MKRERTAGAGYQAQLQNFVKASGMLRVIAEKQHAQQELTKDETKFLKEVVEVFRKTGQSVPVFNDKHLSWSLAQAREMVGWSRDLKFGLMAGSSLPVTWRTPSLEMSANSRVRQALCGCYGGVDSYDFHGLETIQCMVERRAGGEIGVKWVQAYRGENFWKAYQDGIWPHDLMDAALCRSHTLTPARAGFNSAWSRNASALSPKTVCCCTPTKSWSLPGMLTLPWSPSSGASSSGLRVAGASAASVFRLIRTVRTKHK